MKRSSNRAVLSRRAQRPPSQNLVFSAVVTAGLSLSGITTACAQDQRPTTGNDDSRLDQGSGGDSGTGPVDGSKGGTDSGEGLTAEDSVVPGYANPGRPAGSLARMKLSGAESGNLYSPLGLAEDGALVALPGYNQFWFAWSIFNHGSEVFDSRKVETAPIEGNEICAVPCESLRQACAGIDCIPSLQDPRVVDADDSDTDYLRPESMVVGVIRNGESRAYPHNLLWWHEIVNDDLGGDAIAVTHCPLTFSSLSFDRRGFLSDEAVELGVSGRLFNSNLVFYDRSDESWYSQLLGVGTTGPALGQPPPQIHSFEMTWEAWRTLRPETTVLTTDTGFARDYQSYPYGGYFTDDTDTFSNLDFDETYPGKAWTYGLRWKGAAKAWVHSELAEFATEANFPGPRGVLNDQLAGDRVAIVFDLEAAYVQAFLTDEELEASW